MIVLQLGIVVEPFVVDVIDVVACLGIVRIAQSISTSFGIECYLARFDFSQEEVIMWLVSPRASTRESTGGDGGSGVGRLAGSSGQPGHTSSATTTMTTMSFFLCRLAAALLRIIVVVVIIFVFVFIFFSFFGTSVVRVG